MDNLRKRICLVLSQPGDSDLLRGCLCTTRVRNWRMESPRMMESRLKMRVMTRQQQNLLILTPQTASSIQTAGILAASYHAGQPAKSTDVEALLKLWRVASSNHIELDSLDIDEYHHFPKLIHIHCRCSYCWDAPWMLIHHVDCYVEKLPIEPSLCFGGTFSWTAKWTSHKPW